MNRCVENKHTDQGFFRRKRQIKDIPTESFKKYFLRGIKKEIFGYHSVNTCIMYTFKCLKLPRGSTNFSRGVNPPPPPQY